MVVETIGPHEDVQVACGLAQQLGQPTGAETAVHLHLPEPVLGMDVAEGEIGIRLGGGVNVGYAMTVPYDLDRRRRAHDRDRAVLLGQRPPYPEGARKGEDKGEDRETAPHPPHRWCS